jgi:hypothetical protein
MKATRLVIALATLALAGCGPRQEVENMPAEADPPPAAQWLPVARTGDGGALQYDPARTKADPSGKLIDVVVRIRHPYLEGWVRDLPEGYSGETVFQTEQATLRFDCAARTMGVVAREALGADDAVIDKRTTPEPVVLGPISAGGVAEAVYPRVCPPAAP